MRANKAIRAVALLLFVAGLCLVLYAPVTRLLLSIQANNAQSAFLARRQQLSETASEGQEVGYLTDLYEQLVQQNEQLFTSKQAALYNPAAFEQSVVDLSRYGIDDGVFGLVRIPSIDVMLPLYLGADSANMAKGAAQMSYTSYPIDTPNTNSVIVAHRGWGGGDFFRYVDRLVEGDEIIVENLWYTMVYRVTETKIVRNDELDAVLIREGRRMITLSTCHPYMQRQQRYLVFAELSEIKN